MSSKLRYKVMSEAEKQHYCDSVSELIRLNVTELMIWFASSDWWCCGHVAFFVMNRSDFERFLPGNHVLEEAQRGI